MINKEEYNQIKIFIKMNGLSKYGNIRCTGYSCEECCLQNIYCINMHTKISLLTLYDEYQEALIKKIQEL